MRIWTDVVQLNDVFVVLEDSLLVLDGLDLQLVFDDNFGSSDESIAALFRENSCSGVVTIVAPSATYSRKPPA